MCGIVGFIGQEQAAPILLDGLAHLEYRGYDSAGVAVISAQGKLQVEKAVAPAQRAELDWLLYNKPLEYAQLVLSGEIEHYLSLGCDHGRLED